MGYFSSSVGRKQVMGITGLVWALFVFTHMLGNMLIFVSSDAYNKYSHMLVSNELIYIAEAGLVITLVLHAIDGIWLTLQNRASREQKYAMPTNGEKRARFQSKYMIFHGSILLVFIVLHLATFKYGAVYTTNVGGVEMRDIYRLVIEEFQKPLYVAWYCFAMVIVGLHLSHGFYSSFASLGIFHPRLAPMVSKFGYIYSAVIAAGFISQPIYVFFCAGAGH